MSPTDPFPHYLKKPGRRRLARLVEAYHQFVWKVAFRVTRNEDDAADICQDVFLRLLLSPPAAGSVSSPRGFLAWRVIGRTAELQRAASRRKRREEEHFRRMAEDGLAPDDIDQLNTALARLPETLRTAMELRYRAELSVREIAATLSVSEREVRRRQEKARSLLRKHLSAGLPALAITSCLETLAAGEVPDAGPALLANLQRIADMGASLTLAAGAPAPASFFPPAVSNALGTSATRLGGLLMGAKKATLAAGLSAALVLGGLHLFVNSRTAQGPGTAEPTASAPAASRTLEAQPDLHVAKRAAAGPTDAERSSLPTAGTEPPSLHGTITTRDGEQVDGARIRVIHDGDWQEIAAAEETDAASQVSSQSLRRLRSRYLERAAGLPNAVSDATGKYAFRRLEPGTYRIVVVHEKFLPDTETLASVSDSSSARADVELLPGLSILGRVVDDAGNAVPGATVRGERSAATRLKGADRIRRLLADWEEGRVLFEPAQIATDGEGRFRLTSLEPTHHDLRADRAGYLAGSLRQVVPGAPEVVLVLSSGSTLSGRVLEPGGRPLEGARVAVREVSSPEVHQLFDARLSDVEPLADGDETHPVTTGPDGRFHLRGVTDGLRDVTVDADGHPLLTREVEVRSKTQDLGDLELEHSRSIAGVVRNSDRRPLADVRVWVPRREGHVRPSNQLSRRPSKALVETLTGADGAFVLEGLGEGEFDVRAAHDLHASGWIRRVRAGARDVEILLADGLQLHGLVVDAASGRPVEGVEVRLGYDGAKKTVTGADGRFEFRGIGADELHHHRVAVRLDHEDYASVVEHPAVPGRTAAAPLKIHLSPSTRIDGRVFDVQGRPVEGATIYYELRGLSPAAAGYNPVDGLRALSQADGAFTIAAPVNVLGMSPVPGVFLVATHPSLAPARVGPLELAGGGAKWPSQRLVMEPGAALEGTVTDVDAKAVPGATVRVWPSIPQEETPGDSTTSIAASVATAYTDGDGRYRIRGVGTGAATVEVLSLHHARKIIGGVVIGPDGTQQDVVLEAGWALEGRAVDGEGAALAGVEVVLVSPESARLGKDVSSPFSRRMNLLVRPGRTAVVTDARGRYRFEHVADGEFALIGRAAGYEAALISPVRPGKAVADLVLHRFSALRGRVVAAGTGRPVQVFAVDVVNVPAREEKQKRSGMTDYRLGSEGAVVFQEAAGRYLYDGLRAGTYEVNIMARGFIPFVRTVSLESGQELPLDVALERGGRVEGVVLEEETNRPVEGAVVRAFHSTGNETALRMLRLREPIVTDADGRFRIDGLTAGRHSVNASHPLYLATVRRGLPVEVPGDGTPVEIRMAPVGRLEGRLFGLDAGRGDVGVEYSVLWSRVDDSRPEGESPRPAPFSGIWVNPQGFFFRDSLEPGTYRLELRKRRSKQGEMAHVGPTSGFATTIPVGAEETIPLADVEIRAGETTMFEWRLR